MGDRKRLRGAIGNENTNVLYSCLCNVDEPTKAAEFLYAIRNRSAELVSILLHKGVKLRPDFITTAV